MGQTRRRRSGGTVIYTARTHTTGGRENGMSRSADGRLDVKLSLPGTPRIGTNPEQLLAAGWSACFASALALAAQRRGIGLAADVTIDAEVDLQLDDGAYALGVRFRIAIPAVERGLALALIEGAKAICPYAKATSGNIVATYILAQEGGSQ